jgi:hypothetical protein
MRTTHKKMVLDPLNNEVFLLLLDQQSVDFQGLFILVIGIIGAIESLCRILRPFQVFS